MKNLNYLQEAVLINDEYYTTESLIKETSTSWKTPEWGFPKGRKNIKKLEENVPYENGAKKRDILSMM